MSELMILDVGQKALMTVLFLAGPMLMMGLVVGLIISIFQAATQINEMTLTFIPKILAVGGALLVFMPWMLKMFEAHFLELLNMIGPLLR
jgi:flagellar biosynthetic protein FliQ